MTSSRGLDEDAPRPDISGDVQPSFVIDAFRVELKKRAEFQRASRGRRFNAKALTLQSIRRPDDGDEASRFGLTVTKRVGNAVERNRIKRRFRAVLRGPGVAAQPGHDYVIVARREALTVPFIGLVSDLAKTLGQARSGRASSRAGKTGGRQTKSGPSA